MEFSRTRSNGQKVSMHKIMPDDDKHFCECWKSRSYELFSSLIIHTLFYHRLSSLISQQSSSPVAGDSVRIDYESWGLIFTKECSAQRQLGTKAERYPEYWLWLSIAGIGERGQTMHKSIREISLHLDAHQHFKEITSRIILSEVLCIRFNWYDSPSYSPISQGW